MPSLRQAATLKTLHQISRHIETLRQSLEALECAAAALEDAVAPLAALAEAEDGAPVLRDSPVFAALPLPTLVSLMANIARMHSAELEIKRAVVADCEDSCVQAQARHQDPLAAAAVAAPRGGAQAGGSGGHEAVEAFLQVHITAWMLCVEVSEKQVEADLEMIKHEADSC